VASDTLLIEGKNWLRRLNALRDRHLTLASTGVSWSYSWQGFNQRLSQGCSAASPLEATASWKMVVSLRNQEPTSDTVPVTWCVPSKQPVGGFESLQARQA
jgi:hypothetical protein